MDAPGTISDEALIHNFLAGDVEAFEAIVTKYQRPVVNFIYRMIGDFHESENIAQEAFIKVYRSAHTYEGRAAFTTWLFSIVNHLCCDHLRARSHWEWVSLDDKEEKVREVIQGKANALTPEVLAENAEVAEFIEAAIGQLPVRQRQALVLREYYGFSYRHIAEMTDCSLPAVKSRIHKAKQKLQQRLHFLLD